MTFDATNLYLGCRAIDPDPTRIRAFITDRDDIDSHDRVVFTLDPFNDGRRAFEFGVSALGVQSDAVFNQQGSGEGDGAEGNRDESWDAIWSSAGRVTDEGFVVEAAIPFKSLRFPSEGGVQSWGFFVSRLWPRSEAVETRSMHWDRSNACELCQANVLTGFEDI
ncbi:MAG: carbohydrate binding family 9 domain-containing protein, partial [Gemmatimonadetes bacterium]|nr:carbohydrate binding family 9 domain-containing protein [Gemmatimonadota bacterium]NIR35172.1 carbohydrate binding family 9 domain-containing protein [Actinomycetota bacterium]